jgi:hypothetical protein
MFIVVNVYFVNDSVRELLGTPSYVALCCTEDAPNRLNEMETSSTPLIRTVDGTKKEGDNMDYLGKGGDVTLPFYPFVFTL